MSCLPTGTSFLNNNLNDLKYFFEKSSRFYPQDSFMGKLENLGRYITVIPAHAITAIVFAPIANVYDLAIFFLSELFVTFSFFMCYENRRVAFTFCSIKINA